VLGDGFVKASLFVCVGVIQHRRVRLDEWRLRGLGRNLPLTGTVFALGALALAGLPPFGTFLGKAAIEEAAVKEHYAWVPALLTLAAALAGGAALRAAGRVFLGWGPPPGHDPSSGRAAAGAGRETGEAHDRTPATLFAPAVALLLAGLAVGVTPSLAHAAHEAAVRFLDIRAYAEAVLYGANPGLPAVNAPHLPKATDFIYAAGSAGGAFVFALLALFGHRVPLEAPTMAGSIFRGIEGRLHALHSGHPGDYVAWITVGAAVLGGFFALALR
jgi:multicomponent Na+:H+ antiporter subunit D